MTRRLAQAAGCIAAALLLTSSAALAAGLPRRVGQCATTKVAEVGSRLEGAPDSGSAIRYANGGTQVSYSIIPGVRRSRAGDLVKLCLVQLPKDCPKGDDRGKIYRATNLRMGMSWTAQDTQHSCRGA